MDASRLMEKAMRTEWKTPGDFCTYMRLQPNAVQFKILERFDGNSMDIPLENDAVKAMVICLVWKALSHPGSRTVIVADPETRQAMMGFLQSVVSRRADIHGICSFYGNVVRIGTDPGWQIRCSANVPAIFQGSNLQQATYFIIGAGEDWASECETHMQQGTLVRAF